MATSKTTKFVPNHMLPEELRRSTLLLDDLKRAADDIAAAAIALAPEDTGDYKAGIEAEAGMEGGYAQARVNANDWKSGLIEFGDGVDIAAPLRKGAEASGHRVSETR